MSDGPSNDPAEPPPGAQPGSGGRRYSRSIPRGRYPAVWMAAGLVLLGGSAAIVVMHESGGRPSAQAAFCGLVECSVLRSAAAAAGEPPGSPHPQPFPSSLLTPAVPAPTPTPAPDRPPRPKPTTPGSGPAPGQAPAPAVTPTPAVSPEPARTPQPARTPGPVPTWTPPGPHGPWPSPWPLPPWPSAGQGWSHHSPWGPGQSAWWQGQRSHQSSWW
jgi:hypothetical protein